MTDTTPSVLRDTAAKGRTHVSGAKLKKAALGLAVIAGVASAVGYGRYYWATGQYLVSTDDAYVRADYTTIAPKVSGYISAVLVEDSQPVTAGQRLARIDDRDFRTALDQANADVAAAQATIANLDAQILLQQSLVNQAQAHIVAADAGLSFAREDNGRYQQLARNGVASMQRAQQADTSLQEKTAAADNARAGLLAALRTARRAAEAALAQKQAAARQAELNLGYTAITAPVDGTVGSRTLRVGQYVQAGTQLMAVVPLHAVYIPNYAIVVIRPDVPRAGGVHQSKRHACPFPIGSTNAAQVVTRSVCRGRHRGPRSH
jgi:membrane fusion protein (multidrug efflux system)